MEERRETTGEQLPDGKDEDFSPRITPPYLIGVYLAVNAIPDAYLLLDGPSCFPLKSPSIQGNHDWFSRLTDVSGRAKCVTTRLHPSTVIFSREELHRDAIRDIAAYDDAGGVFVSARPMAAITGLDYERMAREAAAELDEYVVVVPPHSLRSDWLGGYAATMNALAESVDLRDASPRPGRVAVVGYLFDRNEGDHEGNLAELRRLLSGMDLELDVVWLSGEPFQALAKIRDASAIISLPHGRRAARVLAKRLSVPLVETALPFGFGPTERFLRDLGEALDRGPQAEALIDGELSRWAPRLEWVIPFVFQHSRLGYVGDPHYLEGFADMVDMMGARLGFALLNAHASHLPTPPVALPEHLLRFEPTKRFILDFLPRQIREEGLELLVSCNLEARVGEVPVVEFGYPSFFTHALLPRPFLGFSGTVGMIERMANAVRQRGL